MVQVTFHISRIIFFMNEGRLRKERQEERKRGQRNKRNTKEQNRKESHKGIESKHTFDINLRRERKAKRK